MSRVATAARTGDYMRGGVLLLVAAAIACAVVAVMPGVGGRLVPMLLGARAGNPAWSETLFTLVVFGPLILAAAIGGGIDQRSAFAAGRAPGAMLALGLALGLAGITASALDARLAGAMRPGFSPAAPWAMLAWGAGVVALQTAAEEIYFRGWLQPALARLWGVWPALLATALVFALAHIVGGARAPVSLLNLFLGGLVFGMLAARTGGLAAAAGMHFAWNAGEQLVYGLDPNPGVGSFGALADHELVGRALWGGSGEGLNASLAMSFALLAILVPLALLMRGAGPLFSRANAPGPNRSGRVPS